MRTLGLYKNYDKVVKVRNGLTHQIVMDGRTLTVMLQTLEDNVKFLEDRMR